MTIAIKVSASVELKLRVLGLLQLANFHVGCLVRVFVVSKTKCKVSKKKF